MYVTKQKHLIRCKFAGFHDGEYIDFGVLGCDTMYFSEWVPTFQNNVLPPSSGWGCSRAILYRQVRMNVATQTGGKNRGRKASRRNNTVAVRETAIFGVMAVNAR